MYDRNFSVLPREHAINRNGGAVLLQHPIEDFDDPLIGCERAAERLARIILFILSVDCRKALTLDEILGRMQQNHHFAELHKGNGAAIQRRLYRDARHALAVALCLGLDMKVERIGRLLKFKWDGLSLKMGC